VLDAAHPDVTGIAGALDAYVFVAGAALVKHVMVDGEVVVADGQHRRRDAITSRYKKTIERVTA
jgi:formimidoylglutamate deiminase